MGRLSFRAPCRISAVRAILPVLLLLWLPTTFGQTTMYKCVDRDKRVTYSNVSCDKQGLTNSGVVVDRSSTVSMPPLAPPKPPAEKAEKPAATPQVVEPRIPQTVEPKVPPNAAEQQQQRIPPPRGAAPSGSMPAKGPASDAGDIPPLPTVKPPVK
jgi:hypothetical protein